MSELQDLTLLVKSRFPIILVETHEEPRVMELLENAANLEEWPLFTWSLADGLRRTLKRETAPQTFELSDALRHIDKSPQNGVFVFLDAHPFLNDPLNQRLIREMALEHYKTARTLIFVSPQLELPAELARMSARFTLSLPDAEGIRQIIREEADLWKNESEQPLRGEQDALEMLVRHLVGMGRDDARRLIRQAVRDDGMITAADVTRVLRFKHEALSEAGTLELELDNGCFADVAGQKHLKQWLELRRAVFLGENAGGLDVPKGMLLLGVQGGGKSLAAKAVAGSWGLPLLRLDFATLYNKFFGETERNLREALQVTEAMAPCVLWLDEIEKGLAADGGGTTDGGVSRRVLGTLLTWMSERRSKVFLVATANEITSIPPELMRKGRFDEIFFIDLPDAETRSEIFRIHLARRNVDVSQFDMAKLAEAAAGFSGAEIEQAVVAGLYAARAHNQPLTDQLVLAELQRTRPLSVVRAEELMALREWASSRTVMAN